MTDQTTNGNGRNDPRISPVAGCSIAFGLLFIWMLGGAGVQVLTELLGGDESETFSLMLAFPATLLTFAYAVGALWLLRFPTPLKTLGLHFRTWSIPYLVGGTVAGILGVALALGIIAVSGNVWLELSPVDPESGSYMGPYDIRFAFFFFIAYAVLEEIVVRGLLYPVLKQSIGMWLAIGITSLAFSLIHLWNPDFSILPAIDILLAGILFCLLRELTDDLWLAWGVHFGWNIGLVLAGLPVSGFHVGLIQQNWHFVTEGPEILTGGSFGPEGGWSGILASAGMILVTLILLYYKNVRRDISGSAYHVFH